MKRSLMHAAAVLVVALSGVSSASEPKIPEFKAYELATYTLITHDRFTASQIPGQAARIDAFLTQQLNTGAHTPSLPTWIWVVPPDLWRRYLEPSDDFHTEFLPARFANYLLLENDVNSHVLRRALFHQYTHAFLRSQMQRYCPLWFEEGMASVIARSDFQYTKVAVGTHARYEGPWIPLARLFQIDRSSPEYLSEMNSGSVYFGSWALVHRAFIEDEAFNMQLFDFLAALNNLNPIDKAVPKSFGVSVEELDRDMRAYARRITPEAIFEVKISPVSPPKVPPGRSMSEVESLVLLAEVMLAYGTKPERLPEVIDAAHRQAADSPEVLTLRMRLAVRDRDDSALGRLLAEIEPRLTEPRIARGAGLALFERVRDSRSGDAMSPADRERLSRRAFELLDRAVMSRPDDLEAIWGYAMLSAQLKQDLAIALRRVDSGLAIASYNADLAMAAALIYEAQGEEKKMIPFLVVTARMSKLTDQRAWAIKRVNEVLASQAAATPAATK
ncbi:MAG TPA: hypothetical protein VFO82_14125 [Steroidobacteraceae bacterium]|nr:hypothetical protein [Steroidobacteraceae bacterium]